MGAMINVRCAPFGIPTGEGFSMNDSGSVKREYAIGGSDGADPADAAISVSDVASATDCDAGVSVEEDSLSLANSAVFD